MDFGSQLGALRASQGEALRLIKSMLEDPETVALMDKEAIRRWEAGRQEYGDESIYKTEEELIVELQEELEDAINYASLIVLKASGWRY